MTGTLSLLTSVALSQVAIEHVRVEVGDGTTLDDVTVVLAGGTVQAVGPSAPVPASAQRVDGRGKVLTPGFIELRSTVGLKEVDLEPSTVDDGLTGGGPASLLVPGFRAADGFNPQSVWIPWVREEGLTSLVAAPMHGVLAGTGVWVPLTGTLDALANAKTPVAMFGAVGAGAADAAGGARGGVWLKLREAFADARAYGKNKAAWEQNRWRPLSLAPLHLEALQPVVAGMLPLVLNAHRASDILAALSFAKAEGLKLVIYGGTEAYLVARQLAEARVPVVLVPSEQVPGSFEQLHARDDAAALLAKAGVPLVLGCSDFQKRRLRQEAGIAVAYGLDRNAALSAITLGPAKALGIDREVGTVTPGKRADVVLWSGDPLELSSVAERVFIGGKEQPKDSRQRALVERYLSRVPAAKKQRRRKARLRVARAMMPPSRPWPFSAGPTAGFRFPCTRVKAVHLGGARR
jgi:imidazolonepropionase-like amidohydrolase